LHFKNQIGQQLVTHSSTVGFIMSAPWLNTRSSAALVAGIESTVIAS